MVPPVAEFVDADNAQAVESVHVAALAPDHALDDLADGFPGDPHEDGDGRLVVLLGQVGGVHLERSREARARFGPGDSLDFDPAVPAVDASHAVPQSEFHTREVEVSPESRPLVVRGAFPMALAASASSPGGPDIDDDAFVVELEAGDDSLLEGKEDSEYTCCAHGGGCRRCGVDTCSFALAALARFSQS